MESPLKKRHELTHNRLDGSDIDTASHQIDAFYSPRITDELVTREVNGQKIYGEVFAVITPDAVNADMSEHHPVDQLDSLCLVRYPDTREIGIASRAKVGDDIVLYPGMVLSPEQHVRFGREGDREGIVSEQAILGRVALTGVQGAHFGEGVSRVHGSIDIDSHGRVSISDGRESVDPATRVVIDLASTNKTRVSVASNNVHGHENIIAQQKAIDAREYQSRRFTEIFGAPSRVTGDKYGNREDKLRFMSAETIAEAKESLAHVSDEEIRHIIESHLGEGVAIDSDASVTKIRTDNSLRFSLATHFMNKAAEMGDLLPERVAKNNTYKNATGYPSQMRSREYAAALAIAMLDGTFSSQVSGADKVEFISSNHNGTSINNGQHRLAALRLLQLSDGAPSHIDVIRTYR